MTANDARPPAFPPTEKRTFLPLTDALLWRTMVMIGWRRFILPCCFSIKSLFTCNPCMIFNPLHVNFRRLSGHFCRGGRLYQKRTRGSPIGFPWVSLRFIGRNLWFCEAQRALCRPSAGKMMVFKPSMG